MDVNIRQAQLEDAEALQAVHHATILDLAGCHYTRAMLLAWVQWVSLERVRNAIATHVVFVAEEAVDLVGVGQMDAAVGHIEAIGVIPRAVRRGIGSALLAAIEQFADKNGLPSLTVYSSLYSVPFYQRHGYLVAKGQRSDKVFGFPIGADLYIPAVKMERRQRFAGSSKQASRVG